MATVFRKNKDVSQVSEGSAVRGHPGKTDLSPGRIRRAFPQGIHTEAERIRNRTGYYVLRNTARPITVLREKAMDQLKVEPRRLAVDQVVDILHSVVMPPMKW